MFLFKENCLNDFINELSSDSPAPGGGTVAALSGALGSALGSMVFNLTVGKKIYNEYDEEVKKIIDNSLKQTTMFKEKFLSLMDEDSESFLDLMAAFKLPRCNETEKCYRKQKIEEGYKKALEVPFNTASQAFEVYSHILVACKYGNKNAVSDAGVAAILLQAAIESSILNVLINLNGIKDENYIKDIKNQCNDLIIKGNKQKEQILSIVNDIIKA